MRTFLIADPSQKFASSQGLLLIGPLTLPVFGLEPSLSWVAPSKATGLPGDYESVAVQEREHLPRGGLVLTLCAVRLTW